MNKTWINCYALSCFDPYAQCILHTVVVEAIFLLCRFLIIDFLRSIRSKRFFYMAIDVFGRFFSRLVLIADQWHLNNTILQSKRELLCLRSIVHSENRNQLLELFSHACINFNSLIFNNKQCDINFMCAISRLSQCVEQRKDAKGEINRNYLLIVVGNCVSDSDLKFI